MNIISTKNFARKNSIVFCFKWYIYSKIVVHCAFTNEASVYSSLLHKLVETLFEYPN